MPRYGLGRAWEKWYHSKSQRPEDSQPDSLKKDDFLFEIEKTKNKKKIEQSTEELRQQTEAAILDGDAGEAETEE